VIKVGCQGSRDVRPCPSLIGVTMSIPSTPIHFNWRQFPAWPPLHSPNPVRSETETFDHEPRIRMAKDLNLNLNLKPRLAVNFKRAFQMVFWATPNYLTPGWPLKSASEADKLARSHIPYTISYPISHSSYPICTHTHTHTHTCSCGPPLIF